MVNPDSKDDEEKPLDPAMVRVQARLQRLMLIAGLTLGVGILAVFLAIIYRITAADDRAPVVAEETTAGVAEEAEPVSAMNSTAGVDANEPEAAASAATENPDAEPAVVATLPPVAVLPPPEAEAGSTAPGTPAAVLAVEEAIPADARLIASTVAGGRIVLTYDHFGGTIVMVVDPDTLRVIGRLDLKPE